jgi:hypothetical protein
MSLWAVAPEGCNSGVKELALKGTGEARCRPPRRQAWLRGSMVSASKAGFDLREISPLPRNTLHTCGVKAHGSTGRRTSLMRPDTAGYRGWARTHPSPKDGTGNLHYPVPVRDSAASGLGHRDNRHLPYLAEFIFVNVGGLRQTAKVSSPPRSGASGGAVIVVRGWESQPQGEGPQSVGNPAQSNRMATQRNL